MIVYAWLVVDIVVIAQNPWFGFDMHHSLLTTACEYTLLLNKRIVITMYFLAYLFCTFRVGVS